MIEERGHVSVMLSQCCSAASGLFIPTVIVTIVES